MIQLLKFYHGYIRVKIYGYSPERFMNLCSYHNIMLWDIREYGNYYTMCMSIRSFFEIRSFLKKTHTKVAILEKYGLPFFIPKILKRKVFFVGFIGIIFAMLLMSQYVWAFEIVGNTEITDEYLLATLQEYHVTYGVRKSELDITAIEQQLLDDFYHLSWVSLKLEGTKLIVSIKENEYSSTDLLIQEIENQLGDANNPTNLVSTESGVIASIVTRSGVPIVKKGDSINTGDILVEGYIPIYDDSGNCISYQYTTADSTIWIERTCTYEDYLDLIYQEHVYTNDTYKNYFITLWDETFYLTANKKSYTQSDVIVTKKQVSILDHLYLPFYYGSIQVREYQKTELVRDEIEAKAYLTNKFYDFIKSLEEKGIQIIANDVKIKTYNNQMIASGTYTIWEQSVTSNEVDTIALEASIIKDNTLE